MKKEKKNRKKRPASRKKLPASRITAIVVAGVAAVLVVAMLLGAIAVNNSKMILPNVTLNTLKLSGLTQQEAEEAIRSAGYENSETIVLTVTLPASVRAEITAADTGYHSTAEEAAEAAPPAPPAPSAEEVLLTEIRDLLKERK